MAFFAYWVKFYVVGRYRTFLWADELRDAPLNVLILALGFMVVYATSDLSKVDRVLWGFIAFIGFALLTGLVVKYSQQGCDAIFAGQKKLAGLFPVRDCIYHIHYCFGLVHFFG